MDLIRLKLIGKKIWVSIDETIDINGRYVANAIVGVLSSNLEQNNRYLINTQFLQKVNSNTIATFFDDSMRLILICKF